jgi:hypothetical protein
MTDDDRSTASAVVRSESGPLPLQALLITASELRDRKTKRRRRHPFGTSEAIRLVELGLKAKGK